MTYEDYANRASDAIEGFEDEFVSVADTLEESAAALRRISQLCSRTFERIEEGMKFTDSADERVEMANWLKNRADELWDEFDEAQTNADYVLKELRSKFEDATSEMMDAACDARSIAEEELA